MTLRLCDIGEQGLLARLRPLCAPGLLGDDAAVLPFPQKPLIVVTTDMLVQDVHFSDRTTSAADVGWRAAAANLSDLAAMGATSVGITVCLGLPGETLVEWIEDLYRGMNECLNPFGTPIIGGDVCRSPIITVAIAAYGESQPDQVIRRSAACPGDAILVTGWHGASRAGLELLLNPEAGAGLSPGDRQRFIQAHQRPIPRLDVLPVLQRALADDAVLYPERGAIAGMDSSDGLADAVLQICRASKVGALLDRQHLPFPPAFTPWLSASQRLDWTLYGGEDFELVLCLPPAVAEQVCAQLGGDCALIGTITEGSEVVLRDSTGQTEDMILTLERGFQHF